MRSPSKTLLLSLLLPALSVAAFALPEEPIPAEPRYEKELPVVPEALIVEDGTLLLGRLVDGTVEVTSGTLQVGPITEEPVWETLTADLPAGASEEAMLLARDGRWLVADTKKKTLTVWDADLSAAGTATLPLTRLDDARFVGERLYLLGARGLELFTFHRPAADLDAEEPWFTSPPVNEPLAGAALLPVTGGVLTAGGELTTGEGATYKSNWAWFSEVDEEGRMAFWEPLRQLLNPAPGPVRGMTSNGVIVLVPEAGEEPEMITITDRGDGTFSMWRRIPLDLRGITPSALAPDSGDHGLLAAGLREETPVLLGWPLPPSPQWVKTLAERRKQQQEAAKADDPGRPQNEDRPRFRTALRRAGNQGRDLLVVIPSKDENGLRIFDRLRRDRNISVMVRPLLISQPWPEEEQTVLEYLEIGEDDLEYPVIGLVRSDGTVVGTHTGEPDAKDFFDLMQPLWSPRNPGQAGTAEEMN